MALALVVPASGAQAQTTHTQQAQTVGKRAWSISCTIGFTARVGLPAITATFRIYLLRHRRVGTELIRAVGQAARRAGASRIYWLTKKDNHTARALYDKLAERSGFIQYRKLF